MEYRKTSSTSDIENIVFIRFADVGNIKEDLEVIFTDCRIVSFLILVF